MTWGVAIDVPSRARSARPATCWRCRRRGQRGRRWRAHSSRRRRARRRVAGGDADDVGQGVVARVLGRRVVVGAVVAGGHDEERVGRRGEGVALGAREARAAERGVDHARAVARGVGVSADGVGDVAAAVVAEHAQGHDRGGPVDARPLRLRRRRARRSCPRRGCRGRCRPAAGHRGRRSPSRGRRRCGRCRRRRGRWSRAHRPTPRGSSTGWGRDPGWVASIPVSTTATVTCAEPVVDVPRLGRADGAHAPLVGEQRVVRHRGLAHDAIGLGVDHADHALEVGDRGADADAGLGVDELEPAHGERRVALDVRLGAHVGALLRRRVGGEADDHARDRLASPEPSVHLARRRRRPRAALAAARRTTRRSMSAGGHPARMMAPNAAGEPHRRRTAPILRRTVDHHS